MIPIPAAFRLAAKVDSSNNSKAEKESVCRKGGDIQIAMARSESCKVIDDDGRGRSGSPRFFCLDLLSRGTSRAPRKRAFS